MKNCRDVISELYPYLDRELTAGELIEVEEHLRRCPGCLELVRFEAGVLKLVKRDCGSEKAPDHLREKLLAIPDR